MAEQYIDPPQLEAMIASLVEGGDYSIETLQEILRKMNNEFKSISTVLNPVIKIVRTPQAIIIPEVPTDFTYSIQPTFVRLLWNPADDSARFEVRKGTSWDFALFQARTTTFDIEIDPLVVGTYTYLLRSMNANGDYSDGVKSTTFSIIAPKAPTLNAIVIDNNVLLSWDSAQTDFKIDYYIIYRDNTYLGVSRGSFIPIFETTSGTYLYKVQGVDLAGNVGPFGTLLATVNQPPDFELKDRRQSNFDGNRDHCVRDGTKPSLLAILDTDKVWDKHFEDRGWTSPQQQVDAGYPIYAQPTITSGYYDEVIDYGTLMSNLIVNVDYQVNQLVPTVSVRVALQVSTDNVNWTGWAWGASQFFSSFRYLHVYLEFSAPDDKALAEITQLIITIDVKREVDSGDIIAYASDPGGTFVAFSKPFKDVESITTTADSIEPIYTIYDFVDTPNPTGFRVYALDSSGNRTTYRVSWKARGVV